eukprot:c44570_g1_i1 orf=159-428(+)
MAACVQLGEAAHLLQENMAVSCKVPAADCATSAHGPFSLMAAGLCEWGLSKWLHSRQNSYRLSFVFIEFYYRIFVCISLKWLYGLYASR